MTEAVPSPTQPASVRAHRTRGLIRISMAPIVNQDRAGRCPELWNRGRVWLRTGSATTPDPERRELPIWRVADVRGHVVHRSPDTPDLVVLDREHFGEEIPRVDAPVLALGAVR